jgi:hypothetical protein
MKDATFVIEQLDEALEEREGRDRRKENAGGDPTSGEDRRKGDRRQQAQAEK